jgi:2-polyprenyl-6-methoxyphenol hydroxylase-like FAD-dependent oxidoreductase
VTDTTARCCIAGGGPAGMMLGLLLARAGVEVLVLEKHADFLRDFRGDTIHPSTLELMHELGLLEQFLALPHEKVYELRARFGDAEGVIADFRHLPTRCGFVAFMPQWDFLDFLARHAAVYPTFRLQMRAEATDLIRDGDRVVGLSATTPDGPLRVRADLVVAADGRHSVLRERAGLPADAYGAPMDVLWFRLPRSPNDPTTAMGRFDTGRIFIMLNRGESWQCGFVIPKGSLEEIRARGFDAFRREVARLAPFTERRLDEIRGWDDVKLLTVQVDRLRQWYVPGLLCIGDAAHAMSPVGGVGINLAIQDAVAAANRLAGPLAEGRVTLDDLRAVQSRRVLPTRVTQWLQLAVQRRVIAPVLRTQGPLRAPAVFRLLIRVPLLRRAPARLVGLGVRAEHVRSPARLALRPKAAPPQP